MNKLVEKLREDDFPVLFKYNDLSQTDLEKEMIKIYFDDAIKNNYVNNVYGDIYTLSLKYRKSFVSGEVLAQMIMPDTYVSMKFVLYIENWIPEAIYTVTSVTGKNEALIDTHGYGSYKYQKVYDRFIKEGIYEEEDDNGKYMIAKPLRALCDYACYWEQKWDSVFSLEQSIRAERKHIEELISDDFDELQGKFGIANVENMLDGIRKDLRV